MTVGFIGHRNVDDKESVKRSLTAIIENMILTEHAEKFIFGSVSEFDELCYEVVTELKNRYYNTHSSIRRIYLRAEFEYAPQWYIQELLNEYEETEFPDEAHNAGKAAYVKRNQAMINRSDVLITYYNGDDIPVALPKSKNSGTAIAVKYAVQKHKRIINVYPIKQ